MKISAEGSEVVIRMSVEEARESVVDYRVSALLVQAPDLPRVIGEAETAAAAREYLRAERFDRRLEESRITAAGALGILGPCPICNGAPGCSHSQIERRAAAERKQARRDYGFTDRELRFFGTAEEAREQADALLNAWAKPDREVEFRQEYQCDPYVPCSCGVRADDSRATWLSAHAVDCAYRVARTAQVESQVMDLLTAERSPADAAQERADRMFPDREGRVEGVDR